MKLNALIVIELLLFAAFWLFTFLGGIDEFETIVFFEPEFTYFLIGMAMLTGALIGGLYERWYQERSRAEVTA